MASPTVESRTTSIEDTAVTTHNVDMPTGVVSGNLLKTFFSVDGGSAIAATEPAGWTKFFDLNQGSAVRLAVAFKQSDGTEGATEDWSTDFSRESAHATYRISGHEDPTGAGQDPEASTGTGTLDDSPNPDSLSPTGGSKAYLWFAAHGHDHEDTTTGFPASYVNGISNEGAGAGAAGVGAAERQLTASSEDPSVFTLSAPEQWVACTVAVHPAVAAGFVPYPNPRYTLAAGAQPMGGGM